MRLASIKSHFWSFGLLIGVIVGMFLTSIIVIWEWMENPSGIFHGVDGTNWHFIYDTAISWFIPTFIYVALIAALGHLLLTTFKWYRKR
ncbi:hypothetical protein [Colwellia piezophila]|uniref:hypothetical protein n=1 Tax=Colwellia piezophila TaxID=211668 RepID=UPI00035DC0FE|nr:hypothetical protein [Colwellia piezophila]